MRQLALPLVLALTGCFGSSETEEAPPTPSPAAEATPALRLGAATVIGTAGRDEAIDFAPTADGAVIAAVGGIGELVLPSGASSFGVVGQDGKPGWMGHVEAGEILDVDLHQDGAIVVFRHAGGSIVQLPSGDRMPAELTSGSRRLEVLRLDTAGGLSWDASLEVPEGEVAGLLATAASGDIALAGSIQAESLLKPATGTALVLPHHGLTSSFVARVDASGAVIWTGRAEPTGVADPGSVTVQRLGVATDGDLIVQGIFQGEVTWGKGTEAEIKLTATGDARPFISRYDNEAGRLEYVVTLPEDGFELIDVADLHPAADNGTLLLVNARGVLHGGTPATEWMRSDNPTTAVVHFDPKGAIDWVASLQGGAETRGRGIGTLDDGRVVAVGWTKPRDVPEALRLVTGDLTAEAMQLADGETKSWMLGLSRHGELEFANPDIGDDPVDTDGRPGGGALVMGNLKGAEVANWDGQDHTLEPKGESDLVIRVYLD